jgi:hypothetical protein
MFVFGFSRAIHAQATGLSARATLRTSIGQFSEGNMKTLKGNPCIPLSDVERAYAIMHTLRNV